MAFLPSVLRMIICVKPYFTNDININRDYYNALYDDIIFPDKLAGIHYKAAIKVRNRWMIDNSDFVLIYTFRNYGGAYEAKKYAERSHKNIAVMLAGLVEDSEKKSASLKAQCEKAERELESSQSLIKDLNDQYDEILSWSSLYDSASIEANKMIVNSMIKRVDVYRNYELNVELNMNIRQFFLGEKPDSNSANKKIA